MILRDQYGEVQVGIGDLFEYQGATLEVVCPEYDMESTAQPVICVRLKKGVIEKNGERFEVSEENNNIRFNFTADLVAACVRNHRLMTFDIPAPDEPVQPVPKGRRAPASKKEPAKQKPTNESGNLF